MPPPGRSVSGSPAGFPVNGRDFSKVDHEGQWWRPSGETIVVQVCGTPHPTPMSHCPAPAPLRMSAWWTLHTDGHYFEHIMALAKLRPATPPVPDICPFLLSDSTPADGERTEEYIYEEVELCRQNSLEKLGLTLCYRTDDEEDMAIYVSQVEPHSLAAKDGRIKEGDRIVQINGCEVHDREKAVALLSSEDTRSVILLVTRPELQVEDEVWLDDDQQELVELKMEILEQRRRHKEQKFDRRKELQLEEGMTTDTATCSSNNQDSGFGHGTDSPDHQPLLSRMHKKSPAQCLRERWLADHPHKPQKTQSKTQDNSNSPMLGLENRFQQLLELKCQIRNGVECGVYSIRHSIECSLTEQSAGDEDGVNSGESEGGVEHELRMLNES
ncbi:hypothetical protein WMY93_021707 [Mugilogobius chulae]|uniref:PDZ domain-containing protein n=1 Tax=Mugilogobius chulae TaxID=88201 RepID=A0AAW0NGD9_9GOBI